jgi:RsmE family RNA methyltransferase
MHRFFVTTTPVNDHFSITDRELVHQIKDVLDLNPAEQIIVAPGDGTELLSEIVSVGAKEISLKIIKKQLSKPASKRTVALYCALLKRDNFEWVLTQFIQTFLDNILIFNLLLHYLLGCQV